MRYILTVTLALAALVFTGCKDGKGKILDPNAKISIRPATMPQGSATATATASATATTSATATASASKAPIYPTPLEVVQKTTDIVLVSPLYPDEPWVNAGISEEQKDLTTPKIMMWGMWVIENGQISRDFVEAKDVIFVKSELIGGKWHFTDTLAYIPNAQLRTAEVSIKAAFAIENYDEVYRLFDEAYKFTPINGTDWLELKRQGLN